MMAQRADNLCMVCGEDLRVSSRYNANGVMENLCLSCIGVVKALAETENRLTECYQFKYNVAKAEEVG